MKEEVLTPGYLARENGVSTWQDGNFGKERLCDP